MQAPRFGRHVLGPFQLSLDGLDAAKGDIEGLQFKGILTSS